ncbi:MAG: hypothetical protein AMJ81_07925 [Phycisphaerae bacterium SM23_33]|nr:MAG: hypothetical protein AMJ81_07925 [Phycisphaerae bacterium SM23_33]
MGSANEMSRSGGFRPHWPPRAIPALSAICVSLLGTGCQRPPVPATGPTFSVLTQNVCYTMPAAERTVQAIRQADADVVCLQETSPAWEALLRKELGEQYRYMRFRHVAGAGGQGFLSKFRFEDVYYRKAEGTWHPGWLIRVDTPAGRVQILNVHLRPPVAKAADGAYRFSLGAYFGSKQVRRRQLEQLLGWVDHTRPTLVVGDLNEPEGGRAVSYARGEKGFRDALSQFDPWSHTWKVGRWPLWAGARLDHILHTPDLQCLHARVIKQTGSDHRPVVARFQAKQPGAAAE